MRCRGYASAVQECRATCANLGVALQAGRAAVTQGRGLSRAAGLLQCNAHQHAFLLAAGDEDRQGEDRQTQTLQGSCNV